MNPYEVLGVSPNDDEETIKKAYRNLVKKYHPDRYANSPLAEQASEKLKEINLAYDIITGKSQPTGNTGYAGTGGYSGGYQQTNFEVSFESVRTLITMRMTDAAEQMLGKLPQTAEWFFLKGIIYMNRGWYQKAREFINQACTLDPNNVEYRQAQQSFAQRAGSYRSYGTRVNPMACCLSGICLSQMCCGGRYMPCFCFC